MTKKGLIRENDKLWSRIIKLLAKEKCEICGRQNALNSHHWYKGKKSGGVRVRWNLNNGVCVCAGCHFEAHQSGGSFCDKLLDKWGVEKYDKACMNITAEMQKGKMSIDEMEIIHEALKHKLEVLDDTL